jgi:leucyl aminopeptidase
MLFGLKQMELPLSHISAISHKTGLVLGKIEVSTAGGTKLIDMIDKKDVAKVAQIISDLVNWTRSMQSAPIQSPVATDLATQLERLAALRNQGILTDAEFQQQKAKLLSQ